MSRYVVLGASRGIGAALVASLAADGHSVLAGARSVGVMRHEFREFSTVHPLYCDVTNRDSVLMFWEQLLWAGGNVAGLVVTVGAQGEINRVADSDPAAWWETARLNLYGPYLAIRYGLAHLTPDARVLVCAGGGSHAPWPHYSAYACAKAGLVRLVETLAQEIPQPVNALAPGLCATMIHRATLDAGPERAGPFYYEARDAIDIREAFGMEVGESDDVQHAVACARWLLHDAPATLTGRTISAQHDPWPTNPDALLMPRAGTTMRVPPPPAVVTQAIRNDAASGFLASLADYAQDSAGVLS